MANTEIQRIPGAFVIPSGWPKLTFPDTTSGLLADWRADTLSVGTLGTAGWISNTPAGVSSLKQSMQTPAPTIQVDSDGRKYVKLGTTRLSASADWNSEMTFLFSMRPHPTANDGSSRRIFSGPSNNFRGLYYEGRGIVTAHQVPDRPVVVHELSPKLAAGTLLVAGARFGAAFVDGFVAGVGWSSEGVSNGIPNQNEIGIGANASSPPLENSYMHADLYRIQVWGRLLSKLDLEAAALANQRAYS